jgi:hypothetical protein
MFVGTWLPRTEATRRLKIFVTAGGLPSQQKGAEKVSGTFFSRRYSSRNCQPDETKRCQRSGRACNHVYVPKNLLSIKT